MAPSARPLYSALAIWAACLAGAGLAAVRGSRPMQRAAVAFLGFIALQQLMFLLNAIVGFSWRGPSAAYLDMFALPFYALFGGYLLVGWCETPGRPERLRVSRSAAGPLASPAPSSSRNMPTSP
jgi:hypothetical protein